MRSKTNRIALAFLTGVMLCASALAGTKSKEVTFNDDVTVGGTLVKKGTYKVTFDDQSKELRITRRGKVIAQVQATLEDLARSPRFIQTYTSMKSEAGARILSSISLGDKNAVIKSDNTAGEPAPKAEGQQ